MMNVYIQDFPEQLKTALELGEQAIFEAPNHPIHNIIALGMGGSGIGANFVSEIIQSYSKVPFIVCKGYTLPSFVGKNTLVIACSFSGNTEETLTSFEQALTTEAKVICISTGGKLIARAKELGLDTIQIPPVQLPPRACLGYSMVQQLVVLKRFGFAPPNCLEELKQSIDLLKEHQESIKKEATDIAKKMHNKFPVIYATTRFAAVALRLRQQLGENSKLLSMHQVIPEMNHNELVGWRTQNGDFCVLIFKSKDDLPKNQARIAICTEIMAKVADSVIEVDCLGTSLIEQAMYAVHLGDWLSLELALLRGVDPIEVEAIDFLKNELAVKNK